MDGDYVLDIDHHRDDDHSRDDDQPRDGDQLGGADSSVEICVKLDYIIQHLHAQLFFHCSRANWNRRTEGRTDKYKYIWHDSVLCDIYPNEWVFFLKNFLDS